MLAGASNYLRNPANMGGVPVEECSTHAEIAVLKRAKNVRGSTVYVARVLRNGQRGLARPCKRCQADLVAAGVRQAIWTINDNSYGVTLFRGIDFE